MPAFNTITITRTVEIATLTIESKDRKALTGPHVEIGAALAELRYDNGVRVAIITGDDAFSPAAEGLAQGQGPYARHDWDLTRACTAPTSRSSRSRSRRSRR